MTLYVVDVSKYQVERSNPLNLATALAAGFGGVNIALDRGRAEDVLPPWAPTYATGARALGMEVCTYRWLDNRLSGAASARRAYDRMVALGGPAGMAHSVDCEDSATEATVRDYVTAMTSLLGRPIALYTGDWWWMAPGRKWSMAESAPYLWAAPNVGYVGTYPGDDSPLWTAGYGGWPTLSLMQYAVKPLPDTGDCSLTAVRDLSVWKTLTGGNMVLDRPDFTVPAPPNAQITPAEWWLWLRLKEMEPNAQLGGFVAAKRGFHSSGAYNEANFPGDYSIRDAVNRSGPWWRTHCSALDWTFPDAQAGSYGRIALYSQRLDRSGRDPADPRLDLILFEWYGQTDNDTEVEGWNELRDEYASSDPSHLWHIHLSFLRSKCGDFWAMWALLTVLMGWSVDRWRASLPGAKAPEKEATDMQPVLIKLEGDPTVRLVTMGLGHIPVIDDADLKRWQRFMSDNSMNTTVWPWAPAMRPQCGPDLTAVAHLEITPEVAAVIAQQIVASGGNPLGDADLEAIANLVVAGAKRAAREGTG